jgi:hypothetical protein
LSDDDSRQGVLEVIESFVDKIQKIRLLLAGISVSALILAPFAIGMSVYLITHEQFYFILDEYDEFGTFLSALLGTVIVISIIWLALGMRQYVMLKSWNERYTKYIKRKEEIDEKISSQFRLDDDQQS